MSLICREALIAWRKKSVVSVQSVLPSMSQWLSGTTEITSPMTTAKLLYSHKHLSAGFSLQNKQANMIFQLYYFFLNIVSLGLFLDQPIYWIRY